MKNFLRSKICKIVIAAAVCSLPVSYAVKEVLYEAVNTLTTGTDHPIIEGEYDIVTDEGGV